MILVEPAGKEIFKRLCSKFGELKLEIQDKGGKESVAIYLPRELRDYYKKQFGTVQYMGNAQSKPTYIDTVEVRFYKKALEAATVVELVRSYPGVQFKGNGENPYFHMNLYSFDDAMSMDMLFQKLAICFGKVFKSDYNNLPSQVIPGSIDELPRY